MTPKLRYRHLISKNLQRFCNACFLVAAEYAATFVPVKKSINLQ
jgi:hypothetical protein